MNYPNYVYWKVGNHHHRNNNNNNKTHQIQVKEKIHSNLRVQQYAYAKLNKLRNKAPTLEASQT